MNIIRQIDVFNNQTDKLVEELPVRNFKLEIFNKRFKIQKHDPEMYAPYEISSITADLFPDIKFDFSKYSYFMACYQK